MSENLPELGINEENFEKKPKKRPALIEVLSILLIIFGILYIISFINLANSAKILGINYNRLLINLTFLIILSICAGIGLWVGKKWGWWLGVLFFLLQVFRQISSIFTLGSLSGELGYLQNPFIQIIFSLPTIIFLFQNSVLEYLKLDRFPKWKSLLILVVSAMVITGSFYALSTLNKTGDTYANLGFVDIDNGNLISAVENLEKSLTEGVDFYREEDVYMALGKTNADLGNLNKSIEHYTTASEINPVNPVIWFNLCELYIQMGDLDSAEQNCYQALSIDPNHANANADLGLIYLLRAEFQKSMQFLEKSLEINPDNPITWANLCYLYIQLGDLDSAEQNCYQALSIDPNEANANANLGLVYLYKGELLKSIQFLENSLNTNPNMAATHGNLALAYAAVGQFESAELQLQQAEALGLDTSTIKQTIENIQNGN